MVRLSNSILGTVNVLTLLLAIPILGGGIWLSARAATDCERFLERPAMVLGLSLMVISLAGLVGAWCRNSLLLWIYLAVMSLLILVLLCFTVFAFFVTNRGAGEVVSGLGFKEYRLGDYSNWLQKRIESDKNWAKIRSCLSDSNVCLSMQEERKQTVDQFIRDNLSPIQSGCCKPPTACNYTSGTLWDKPAGLTSNISDCNTWRNDPNDLCFDCQSCKAGVVANIKNNWKKVAVINISFLIFLVVVYSIGCCAIRNKGRQPEGKNGSCCC